MSVQTTLGHNNYVSILSILPFRSDFEHDRRRIQIIPIIRNIAQFRTFLFQNKTQTLQTTQDAFLSSSYKRSQYSTIKDQRNR